MTIQRPPWSSSSTLPVPFLSRSAWPHTNIRRRRNARGNDSVGARGRRPRQGRSSEASRMQGNDSLDTFLRRRRDAGQGSGVRVRCLVWLGSLEPGGLALDSYSSKQQIPLQIPLSTSPGGVQPTPPNPFPQALHHRERSHAACHPAPFGPLPDLPPRHYPPRHTPLLPYRPLGGRRHQLLQRAFSQTQ